MDSNNAAFDAKPFGLLMLANDMRNDPFLKFDDIAVGIIASALSDEFNHRTDIKLLCRLLWRAIEDYQMWKHESAIIAERSRQANDPQLDLDVYAMAKTLTHLRLKNAKRHLSSLWKLISRHRQLHPQPDMEEA